MNDTNPTHPENSPQDDLAPLDDFEQQWVDQLAQREPDLVQSEDAFVQSVMQAEATSLASDVPAVIGRIGTVALPYAIAAALLLAAFVGWYVLTDGATNTPSEPSIVKESTNPTQPIDGSSVATHARPKIELGKLIANVQSTATSPANTLTATVSEVPETLSIDRLFDLLGDSVPDLQEILAPLKPNDEQSRA